MSEVDRAPHPSPPGADGVEDGAGRRISSSSLFRGREEIVITHRDQEYRLRITRTDKLILTK